MDDRRLKIGIFVDSFYPEIDGVVVVADYLAAALAKFNDVTVIIPDMGSEEVYERPYEIIRVKSIRVPFSNYRAGLLRKTSKEYRRILEKNFDLIHVHSPFILGKAAEKIAKELKIPVFSTVHSQYYIEIKKMVKLDLFAGIVMRYVIGVYNAADVCFVVSKPLADDVKKSGYRYEPVVVPNATDLTPPGDTKQSNRRVNELYHFSAGDTVLLFVGRLSSTKNIFFLLESLRLLKEDGYEFKMLFVGFGPDENKLKDMIHEYGMEDCVQVTGKISDRELLSAIYARTDLLVFPSMMDTCTLVRMEAAVNETPALVIDDSMVAYFIIDNENGFVAPLDPVKYKNRMKEILDNRELLRNVSVKAKETMSISWDEVAKVHYREYIKELEKNV